MLNIVLYQPEIPQNTGNIASTCVAIGAKLHIIKPIPFEITDKEVKRAGLDYWQHLNLKSTRVLRLSRRNAAMKNYISVPQKQISYTQM